MWLPNKPWFALEAREPLRLQFYGLESIFAAVTESLHPKQPGLFLLFDFNLAFSTDLTLGCSEMTRGNFRNFDKGCYVCVCVCMRACVILQSEIWL